MTFSKAFFAVAVLMAISPWDNAVEGWDMNDHDGTSGDSGKPKPCWPDESKMAECFRNLPSPDQHMPTQGADDYVLDGRQGFDEDSYVYFEMSHDPDLFCTSGMRAELIEAMTCMQTEMQSMCPMLPDEMFIEADRAAAAFDYFCQNKHKVDQDCLSQHMPALHMCQEQMGGKKKGKKSGQRMGGDAMQQDPVGEWEPTAEREATGGWDPSAEHEPTGEWDPSAEHEPTSEDMMDMMNHMACQHKFMFRRCVNRIMQTSCSAQGADVMNDVLKMMSSEDCSRKMDAWDASCGEDGDCGGNGTPSLFTTPLLLLLLPLLVQSIFKILQV